MTGTVEISIERLKRLEEENAEMREALEFYATNENFIFFENRFCEYHSSDAFATHYDAMGALAAKVIAKVENEQ